MDAVRAANVMTGAVRLEMELVFSVSLPIARPLGGPQRAHWTTC
jgi:hypothetical protein